MGAGVLRSRREAMDCTPCWGEWGVERPTLRRGDVLLQCCAISSSSCLITWLTTSLSLGLSASELAPFDGHLLSSQL
jgi:hypothetical protein